MTRGPIITFDAFGSGDMGSTTDLQGPTRFTLDADRFAPVFVRAAFSGGSGSATLALKLDHHSDITRMDRTLQQITSIGTGGTAFVHYVIPRDELDEWRMTRGDYFVLDWTNPNTQTWSVTVGLAELR
jgi:hypothetical protein